MESVRSPLEDGYGEGAMSLPEKNSILDPKMAFWALFFTGHLFALKR